MKFNAFGIPVKVEFTFFVTAVLLGYSRGSDMLSLVEWVVVVFCSVLLHELGHALTGKAFGLQPRIILYGMGGGTFWTEKRLSPLRDILVSAAGPFAGFMVGLIVLGLSLSRSQTEASPFVEQIIRDLWWVNIYWGIFNMFPVLPMDGGNVMRSVELLITKKEEPLVSLIISVVISIGVALFGLIVFKSVWLLIIGGWFAFSNLTALVRIIKDHRDRPLREVLKRAWQAADNQDGALAVKLSQEVIDASRSDAVKKEATKLLIHGLIQQRRFESAIEEFRRLQGRFGTDPYLQGLLLMETGQPAEAIKVLAAEFGASPAVHVGHLLAQALVRETRYDDALKVCAHPALSRHAPALCNAFADEAFQAGRYHAAAEFGRRAFELGRDPLIAFNVSCALSRAARLDESLEWLDRAVDAGFRDKNLLSSDPDLEPVRRLPGFRELYERLDVLVRREGLVSL